MTILELPITEAEWNALDALPPRDQPAQLARILGPRRAREIMDASRSRDTAVIAVIVPASVACAVTSAAEEVAA